MKILQKVLRAGLLFMTHYCIWEFCDLESHFCVCGHCIGYEVTRENCVLHRTMYMLSLQTCQVLLKRTAKKEQRGCWLVVVRSSCMFKFLFSNLQKFS